LLALSFLGANIGALSRFALLPSRRKDASTEGLPIQTRAQLAGVTAEYALGPAFRIQVALDEFKRAAVERALRESGGNWAEAALRLGMHRSNLHHMARRLGIRTAGRRA
jgi:transcriptional regulator with GAF, ATPase, and Fis domain